MPEQLNKVFIDVEVDAAIATDTALAAKLEEVCPVDIFEDAGGRVEIVEKNLDECVLCKLCIEAAPPGTVHVRKLYDGTELS
jgi:NAD-dependent dihydropyrimidine dehydrogenase PreA subunit